MLHGSFLGQQGTPACAPQVQPNPSVEAPPRGGRQTFWRAPRREARGSSLRRTSHCSSVRSGGYFACSAWDIGTTPFVPCWESRMSRTVFHGFEEFKDTLVDPAASAESGSCGA